MYTGRSPDNCPRYRRLPLLHATRSKGLGVPAVQSVLCCLSTRGRGLLSMANLFIAVVGCMPVCQEEALTCFARRPRSIWRSPSHRWHLSWWRLAGCLLSVMAKTSTSRSMWRSRPSVSFRRYLFMSAIMSMTSASMSSVSTKSSAWTHGSN